MSSSDVVNYFVIVISERATRQAVNVVIPEHNQDIQVAEPKDDLISKLVVERE